MRNAKMILLVLILIVALAVPGSGVIAQSDDEPETETTAVTAAAVTEDIDAGAVQLSEALGFLVVFLTILQAHGMVVSGFLEETIKPALNKMVELEQLPFFGKYGKVLVLGAAAFGFGVWENTSGNINLLADTPYPYFEQMAHYELALVHGALSVGTAFIGHRTWEIIGAYAKRAKAAADAFAPPS